MQSKISSVFNRVERVALNALSSRTIKQRVVGNALHLCPIASDSF